LIFQAGYGNLLSGSAQRRNKADVVIQKAGIREILSLSSKMFISQTIQDGMQTGQQQHIIGLIYGLVMGLMN